MRRQGRLQRKPTEVEEGTAAGQLLFWDDTNSIWAHTETTELYWDDTNKRLGINRSDPAGDLDINGTGVIVRLLAGGVQP